MKPYFRDKGKYKDGRRRVVIEFKIGRDLKSIALPKPEKLLKILDGLKNQKFSS
jgi:hypothetical protein